jgi:hypothetical protein
MAMIIAAAALTLAACTTTETPNLASAEYRKLEQDCKARGGELKPVGGVPAANDSANYACEFKGASPKTTGQ